jgi:zinc transport system substrate-binding protein
MALAACTALLPAAAVAAPPSVLATIKPIHSLAAAVMQGVAEPVLLIQGARSEHSYAFRPSDGDKIRHAQIVFEIGPDLETSLERPLASLAPHAHIVPLEQAEGVHRLRARRGGLWENVNDSDEGPYDPHIWLDPENAIAMTRAIAAALTRLDPANGPIYKVNRDKEIASLSSLEAELQKELVPLRARKYIVFHDAYRYFEFRFGLNPTGAVTVAPDRPVGPRRIEALRRTILEGGIDCVFREPQFPPALVKTLTDGSRARIGVLDPLGADIEPGPGLYPTLLRALAASLTACMSIRTKKDWQGRH